MNFSAHFSRLEFEASEIAVRAGIDNTIPDAWIPRAVALCENVLEPARMALGPIRINSGYRCKALNTKVGGAWKSQHQFGQAADIIPLGPGVKLGDLFRWIHANCPFDQMIWEFGSWVHVSYAPQLRREVLEAISIPGKKRAIYNALDPERIAALGL